MKNLNTVLAASILLSFLVCVLSTAVPDADIQTTLKKERNLGLRPLSFRKGRRGRRRRPGGDGFESDDESSDGDGNSDGDENSGGDGDSNTSSTGDDEALCFPGNARVVTKTGRHKTLSELQVGDEIATTSNTFSRVFAFTHRLPSERKPFVRIATTHGNLTATRGHYVHTPDGIKKAGELSVGNFLISATGNQVPILRTDVVYEYGLFNPHTLSGSIVVDGFQATCFTEVVSRVAAQSLLTPFRWLFQITRSDVLTAFVQNGVASWTSASLRSIFM